LEPVDGEADFEKSFKEMYKDEFGFLLEGKKITIDDIKVRGIGKTYDDLGPSVFEEVSSLDTHPVSKSKIDSTHSVYFEERGRLDDTPVYLLPNLEVGEVIHGPAMVIDDTQTIVVDIGAQAVITTQHLFITL